MSPEAKVAYIQSQIACAMAEIEAMKAFNATREAQRYAPGYTEEDFRAIPDRYGIHCNAVISYLQDT